MHLAIVGAGVISEVYLRNLTAVPEVRIVRIADLDPAAAKKRSEEFDVPAWGDPASVWNDDAVDLVLNLTPPQAHHGITMAAIAAGKHVWCEKPLALTTADSAAQLAAAREAGVIIGCAPDTWLGPGWSGVREAIREGVIGRPLSALIQLQTPGPDFWHPSPEFLYARGAGPLLDMAPYYLTALVTALGPISAVTGVGGAARAEREVLAGPRTGTMFPVEVLTEVAATIQFANGMYAAMILSNDSVLGRNVVEISGTSGLLEAPNPNMFGGDITVIDSPGGKGRVWRQIPDGNLRGAGVLDMVEALASGRSPRASGELAHHVLEAMLAIEASAEADRPVWHPVPPPSAPKF